MTAWKRITTPHGTIHVFHIQHAKFGLEPTMETMKRFDALSLRYAHKLALRQVDILPLEDGDVVAVDMPTHLVNPESVPIDDMSICRAEFIVRRITEES